MVRESSACACHGVGAPSIDHSSCLAAATATAAVLSQISLAISSAAGRTSPSGTTRETRPPSSASAAPNTRPVATHSMAREMPTTRGRNQVEAASGTSPRRVKTNPNRALCAAMRMSIGSVIVTPMPTAGPLTAAITGLRHRAMASAVTPPGNRGGRLSRNERTPAARSAPAQKARPRPVTTTTRTA